MKKSNKKKSQHRLGAQLKNLKRKRKRKALLEFNGMVRPFKIQRQIQEFQKQQEEAAKAAEAEKATEETEEKVEA
jgi:hypothetical protein